MKPLKFIGNLLILFSLLGFAYTFYPILQAEWQYAHQPETSSASGDFVLNIPRLKLSAPVIAHVDAFNKRAYEPALEQGIAHAQGTHLPGENGLIYLFAHSSEAPWRMTRQNTAFYRLNRLHPGDDLFIDYFGQRFHYQVTQKQTVWPNDLQVLSQPDFNQLVLQTCTPVGTDFQRLLVFAQPIN